MEKEEKEEEEKGVIGDEKDGKEKGKMMMETITSLSYRWHCLVWVQEDYYISLMV